MRLRVYQKSTYEQFLLDVVKYAYGMMEFQTGCRSVGHR